jgi:hypothetical protein
VTTKLFMNMFKPKAKAAPNAKTRCSPRKRYSSEGYVFAAKPVTGASIVSVAGTRGSAGRAQSNSQRDRRGSGIERARPCLYLIPVLGGIQSHFGLQTESHDCAQARSTIARVFSLVDNEKGKHRTRQL